MRTNLYFGSYFPFMRSCSRCGRMLEDFDVGGDGVCSNCEASFGHGSGGAADVPCQRCGMYLPSHELQMWNSRLYCAYCIMDVRDEEKMMRGGGHSHGDEAKGGDENLQAHYGKKSGTCERCGREAETLYSSQGRMLCSHCYHEGGGSPNEGRPTLIGMLASGAAFALGIKAVAAGEKKSGEKKSGDGRKPDDPKRHGGEKKPGLRTKVFDTKTRKFTDRTDAGKAGGWEKSEGSDKNPDEKAGGSYVKKFLFRLRGKFFKGKEK